MYLFIFEDGSMGSCTEVSEDDKRSCDNGFVSIIRVEDGRYEQYQRGNWVEVKTLEVSA